MLEANEAQAMLASLREHNDRGFTFHRLLGHGKSAAVFEADNAQGQRLAVKVYAPFLATRFGMTVQMGRLDRELSLVNHDCASLVRIVDGGEIAYGASKTSFVAMDFLDGVNLSTHIKDQFPLSDAEIREHLGRLHAAADWLIQRKLCHRDIKTENCQILPDRKLVLLDLGVLKPVQSELTDVPNDPTSRFFVGTQRYAPPELLLRLESDDVDGWTAVNTYQIGAVLYEMIEGKPLFSDVDQPVAALVQSVLLRTPLVTRQDVAADLIQLARRCLIKDPKERLKAVSWSEIHGISSQTSSLRGINLASIQEHIGAMQEAYKSRILNPKQEQEERERRRHAAQTGAWKAIERGMKLPAIEAAKPKIARDSHHRQPIVLNVAANPACGFADSCRFVIWASMQLNDVETVSVHGMGFFGLFDDVRAARLARSVAVGSRRRTEFLDRIEVQSHWEDAERIWHAPLQAEALERAVGDWLVGMIGAYFQMTRERCDLMIGSANDPSLRMRIEASRPSTAIRFTSDGKIYPIIDSSCTAAP